MGGGGGVERKKGQGKDNWLYINIKNQTTFLGCKIMYYGSYFIKEFFMKLIYASNI